MTTEKRNFEKLDPHGHFKAMLGIAGIQADDTSCEIILHFHKLLTEKGADKIHLDEVIQLKFDIMENCKKDT